MEKNINLTALELKERFGFDNIAIGQYQGGYPTVFFILTNEQVKRVPGKIRLKAIVQNSELKAGTIVGVFMNFLSSSKCVLNGNILEINGHPKVMECILEQVFH